MRSLRARLIIVAAIWVAAGVAIAGLLLSAQFRGFLTEQFYHELQEHLDELEGIVEVNDDGSVHMQRVLSDPRYSVPLSGFYWEVQKNGAIAARSNSLEGPMLKVPVDGGNDAQIHHHAISGPTGDLLIVERLRWMSGEKAPTRIVIGTDRRLLEQVLSQFNRVLLWSLGLFSLSMIVVAGLLLAYAMAPIGRLRTAFASYRSGATSDMREFPEEVQPLIDDLNILLAASGEQIQRARAQAGNIAHGLKTPLAILTDEAHQLARKGDSHSAAVILDQCRRMQGQIDYQIARARAAASRAKRGGTASSLSDTAATVMRALGRLHAGRDLRIDNAIPPGVMVACEVEDLNEILTNL